MLRLSLRIRDLESLVRSFLNMRQEKWLRVTFDWTIGFIYYQSVELSISSLLIFLNEIKGYVLQWHYRTLGKQFYFHLLIGKPILVCRNCLLFLDLLLYLFLQDSKVFGNSHSWYLHNVCQFNKSSVLHNFEIIEQLLLWFTKSFFSSSRNE